MKNRTVKTLILFACLAVASSVFLLAQAPPQRGAGGARGAAAPAAAAPRDAQGRADLSGMWMTGGGGARSDAPPYDEPARGKITEFQKRQNIDDPDGLCLLPGIPRIYQMPMPFKIIQLPNEVVFVHEAFRGIRIIPTDGRKHPDDVDPAYLGDSIGHWEGDTLVVDITSFNDRTWLGYGAVHHTDKLHITERITRTNADTISYEATVTDPGVFTKPWVVRGAFALRPNERIREYECGENNLEVTKFQELLKKPELLAPTHHLSEVREVSKNMEVTRPMNGAEFIESLRDGREVYIYGERVKDVTTHPAFRNTARMVARLYDALHDPKHKDKLLLPTDTGSGGMTHAYFKAPKTTADLIAGRDAIAEWARIVYGWIGRSPDYKASFLATLGANAEFYAPYQENAKRWYKYSQERVPFVNHAIIHPPVDRDKPPNEVADICCHVEKETDQGIIVSGAKVVATGSVLTNYTFVAHHGLIPVQDKKFAVVFIVPSNAQGVKFLCRASYEMTSTVMGSPFDYPLSSRLDENDAIFIMDKVLVPWENVFVYGDIEKANNFFPRTGFLPRFVVHGCTRLAVKLDFIAGLLLKAVEATGSKDFRGVQANVGEVIAWRNLFWGLSDAMVRDPKPWIGDYILPNMDPGSAYHVIATIAYSKIKYIIEQTVASGLIYLNSHALDFKNEDIRPYMDKYMRGSNGYTAEDRVKLMKLLWDTLGTEFGGRHELYEINYAGSTEEIRRYALFGAMASGAADRMKGFAEQCMAEYDLDGWRVPDLSDPGELSYHAKKK